MYLRDEEEDINDESKDISLPAQTKQSAASQVLEYFPHSGSSVAYWGRKCHSGHAAENRSLNNLEFRTSIFRVYLDLSLNA